MTQMLEIVDNDTKAALILEMSEMKKQKNRNYKKELILDIKKFNI